MIEQTELRDFDFSGIIPQEEQSIMEYNFYENIYSSKGTILQLLNMKPISKKRLDVMLMKLQEEWCYNFHYPYFLESSDINKDLEFLENYKLIRKTGDSYSLTSKGKYIEKKVEKMIKENPLEKLPEKTTFQVFSEVFKEAEEIQEDSLDYVWKYNLQKYAIKNNWNWLH